MKAFIYILKAFRLLFAPGIKRFVIIPILVNALFFSLWMVTGFYFIGHFAAWFPSWLRWLRWLFYVLFFLTSSLVIVYTFTIFANLIAAPFNSLLAEKVETLVKGEKPDSTNNLKELLREMKRSFLREWEKIKYYVPRAVLLLILFLIPVVNVIASILWFIFACWMMAVEYIDFPMDNHKRSFKDVRSFLRKHYGTSMSFGLSMALLSMIPILNFVALPIGVIAGTLFWLDHKNRHFRVGGNPENI
ncbi:MAG: sulfate transporter CysZ [Pseudomonadota bacterium]|nr:sulfate transporter CysZ [Gammaproteobacteria bacterium]